MAAPRAIAETSGTLPKVDLLAFRMKRPAFQALVDMRERLVAP